MFSSLILKLNFLQKKNSSKKINKTKKIIFFYLRKFINSATSSTVVSSTPNAVSNSAVTTSSMSSPSLGLGNTKVTNSTAKSSGGVVPNIPMVSQYIQTGMPFYQQPVYSYEDIQMMQQRMPPHVVNLIKIFFLNYKFS